MEYTIFSNVSVNIKELRRKIRKTETGEDSGVRLSIRNGRLFSQVKVDILQPRTEEQEKNWLLFKEANRRVARDFEVSWIAKGWKQKAQQQKFDTARGCARAYYIEKLKKEVEDIIANFDINRETQMIIKGVRLNLDASVNERHVLEPIMSWKHYREVEVWKKALKETKKSKVSNQQ